VFEKAKEDTCPKIDQRLGGLGLVFDQKFIRLVPSFI
jgi:hypothetical protein